MQKNQIRIFFTTAMRISFIQFFIGLFFITSCYAHNADAQEILDKSVNLSVENREIKEIIADLQQQTGIKFVFSSRAIDAQRKISINVLNIKLGKLLSEFFRPLNIDFKVLRNQVLLYRADSQNESASEQKEVFPELTFMSSEVTGKVTTNAGVPLANVSVIEKGTSNGTTTADDGSFKISVSDLKSTILFSFIGYDTREVALNGQSFLTVSLQPYSKLEDAVVVVGYGTQKKRNVTGSITSIKSDQIVQVPIISPEQALQGRAAGVQVMQSNGAPGGAVQVQIRGVNSTSANGNQPLYVVDGIPLIDPGGEQVPGTGGAGRPENNAGSPLATINPNDIESMEILKDASASAIYGARAANGVVVITTKSGKAGKTLFSIDYYRGIQKIQRKWDLQNAIEGMVVRNEALLNTVSDFTRNINPEFFNPYAFATSPAYKNNDFQDALFRNSPIQDINLTASGGTDKVRFLVSGNYFDQQGIFLNTNMKRFSNRVNLDLKANEKLSFGIRTTTSYQDGNNVTDGNPFQGTVVGAFYFQAEQAYFPDGSYWQRPNLSSALSNRNPVFEAREYTRKIDRFRFNGNAYGEYEIIKSLKYKATFGLDYTTLGQKNLNPAIPRGPAFEIAGPDPGAGNTTRMLINNANSYNWISEHTLTYNKKFGEHQLDGLLGFSAQSFTTRGVLNRGDGSLIYGLNLVGVNNAQNLLVSESFSQSGLVSQFARVNYNFKGRYLLTSTIRRDGSSNFGTENRYGYFPSVSAGWRISDENFFKSIRFINDFKVRASYGLTGNQNIGSFRFLSRLSSTPAVFGTSVANGFSPNGLANQSIKWEANEQTDFGIDFSILKGRISFIADYYVKNSKDLLVGIPIPSFAGFSSLTVNLGTIQNKGYEFATNARVLDKSFKWDLSINIATLKNTVTELGKNAAGGVNEFYGYTPFTTNGPLNRTTVGYPIGSFYGLVTNGIFQSSQETAGYPVTVGMFASAGDMKYVDQNKDQIINDFDRVNLGSPFPKYYGGITNNFAYKNFSLNVFANFVSGNKIFNHQRLMLEDMLDQSGSANQLKRWRPTYTENIYPRLTAGGASAYNRLNSNRWIDDGSFLRVRNITLAYNLPNFFLSGFKLQSVRVYGSVNNAFTFTKYQGWDPEVNSSGSDVLSSGIDQGGYPVARSFIMGINVKF